MYSLILETLESVSDEELRDVRHMDFMQIISAIESLSNRLRNPSDTAQLCRKLVLNVTMRLLKCPFIERRLESLQFIANICSNRRRNVNEPGHFVTTEYLMQWMEKYKIFDLIFGEESHPQVIRKSVGIVQFMCQRKRCTLEVLGTICASIEREAAKQVAGEEMLLILCELIEKLRNSLQNEHIDFIVSKFGMMDMKVTKYHLKLMSFLSGNSVQSQEMTRWMLKSPWNPMNSQWSPIQSFNWVGFAKYIWILIEYFSDKQLTGNDLFCFRIKMTNLVR